MWKKRYIVPQHRASIFSLNPSYEMAIFRKDHLSKELTELAVFYEELKSALVGVPLMASLAEHFLHNVEDFQRDYTDVDLRRLNRAIGHFKVVADDLKHIKEKAQKPVHGK